jgi:hypothetical protein
VKKALYAMPRGAATCIDGWTAKLCLQAIEEDKNIEDMLEALMMFVTQGQFGPLVMDILRLGRLVGIPKPTGGIRPITVSSFFTKLAGTLIWRRAKPRCSPFQHAIGKKAGCEAIIHQIRQAYADGKAIIRIDISNAFNMATRAKIREVLEGQDPDICMFFKTMYFSASKLAVFGPNDIKFITFEEGVRQGDSFSAFFFCLLIDKVLADLRTARPELSTRPSAYMDDLTIECEPENVKDVLQATVAALERWGFKVNLAKSAVIVKTATLPQLPIARKSPEEQFIVLGANLTDAYNVYNENYENKTNKFFRLLQESLIHPQLKWTILRLCGAPRMLYYASVTPPTRSKTTLAHFDRATRQCAIELTSDCLEEVLHHKLAGGLPHYEPHAEALYEASRNRALHHTAPTKVQLVTNCGLSDPIVAAHLAAQYDGAYLFFGCTPQNFSLSPFEFRIAMSMRLRTLPTEITAYPVRCDCGHLLHTAAELIDHAFGGCTRFSWFTHTARHELVKHAIASVLRAYGFLVTVEPKFYAYMDAVEHRPDITVFASLYPTQNWMQPLATDVVISAQRGRVGDNATIAAQEKKRHHSDATSRLDHMFIPFSMEVQGHRDKCVTEYIATLAQQLPIGQQRQFQRDMHATVATALAKARVATILSMKKEYRTVI